MNAQRAQRAQHAQHAQRAPETIEYSLTGPDGLLQAQAIARILSGSRAKNAQEAAASAQQAFEDLMVDPGAVRTVRLSVQAQRRIERTLHYGCTARGGHLNGASQRLHHDIAQGLGLDPERGLPPARREQ